MHYCLNPISPHFTQEASCNVFKKTCAENAHYNLTPNAFVSAAARIAIRAAVADRGSDSGSGSDCWVCSRQELRCGPCRFFCVIEEENKLRNKTLMHVTTLSQSIGVCKKSEKRGKSAL